MSHIISASAADKSDSSFESEFYCEYSKDKMQEIQTGLCLEWKNLNYYVPAKEQSNYAFWQACQKIKKLQILSDVSGYMKTGDLVAILGCSGSGKTTLLAAISQRLRGDLTGDVVLNGVAIGSSDMTRISSFLPQIEITVQKLTAYEHLYFMSHFKMHRKTSAVEKRQRVSDLLMAVGLRDAAHTRIQHLSGGERKRLSLAEELITDPPFLFCDEPTTGLDSYNAYLVIKTLRHLCTRHRIMKHSLASIYGDDSYSTPSDEGSRNSIEMEIIRSSENLFAIQDLPNLNILNNSPNGHHKKAIICSIHQPTSDIFELFTHIILMDAGRIMFQGSTERAKEFFFKLGYELPPNCNPAEFYLRTISDSQTDLQSGNIIKSKYDNEMSGLHFSSWLIPKTSSGDYLQDMKHFKKIRWFYQVYLLLIRFYIEDSRNIKNGLIGLGLFMITSVTLSIMYSGVGKLNQNSIQDFSGVIYMLSAEIIFTFSYSVTYIFPYALPILRREVGEGTYSLSAYYVAVVLSFLPAAIFKPYLFFAVIYGSVYNAYGLLVFLTMGFVLALAGVSAVGYGLFLSSLFESDKMAAECAAPFDLVFLIFGGAYYNVDSIPFVKYLSIFFYTNEALMYTFWINVDEIGCPTNLDHPCIQNGTEVLQRASFRTFEYTLWADCGGLLAVALCFNILTYFLIRKYVKRSGYY